MNDGFNLYRKYIALKQHFNDPEYDYVKYNGAVTATKEAYNKRNDNYFFERVAGMIPKKETFGYLVANFMHNKSFWIADEGMEIYNKWYGKMSSLEKYINDDLDALRIMQIRRKLTFNDLVHVEEGQHPKLFQLLFGRVMLDETAVLLMVGIGYFNKWEKVIGDEAMYNNEVFRIKRYSKFFDIKNLLKKHQEKIIELYKPLDFRGSLK